MIEEEHSLTEQQIDYFNIFGFIIRRKLFSPVEMSKINEEFEQRLDSISRDVARKEQPLSTNWTNRDPETPFIASLLEDPRIYRSSEQVLGPGAVPVHSNSNSYSKSTPWHTDASERHLLMIKNVMYLQPTTGERGALRLIPGSHQRPMHDELRRVGLNPSDGNESRFLTEFGINIDEIPCHLFCSQPGDVITFDYRIWHSASGGFRDHRTCTFNFFSSPRTAEEKEDLRVQVANYRRSRQSLGTAGPQYHPWWLANPEGNVRRSRWIQWLEEWGFVEAGNH
jgi:hypothetical protein